MLLATGAADDLPDIPGARERWGRDFLHCPYCHGWEVRDLPLGVLGPVRPCTHTCCASGRDDVILFTHTHPRSRPRSARRSTPAASPSSTGRSSASSSADDRLQAVQLADGRAIPRAALFIRPALRAHSDGPAVALGCDLRADGLVWTDAAGRTSVPGVWAAGNATDPRAQVITAAGEGSAVAIAINTELVQTDVDTAERHVAAARRHDRPPRPKDTHDQHHQNPPAPAPPPSRHQLALMIWLCVFPTLTALNLALSDWLAPMSPVVRTFVLATIAVPIVI